MPISQIHQKLIQLFILAAVLWNLQATADVPDSVQECLNNAAAKCRLNNVDFEFQGTCPKGSVTIKAYENINCTHGNVKIAEPLKTSSAKAPPVPAASQKENSPSWWPFLIFSILFIGLLAVKFRTSLKIEKISAWKLGGRWFACGIISISVGLAAARYALNTTSDYLSPHDGLSGAVLGLLLGIFTFAITSTLAGGLVWWILRKRSHQRLSL